MEPRWWEEGACVGMDTMLFYPEYSAEPAKALAVCRLCPVRQECLEAALEEEIGTQPVGIRGGLLANERLKLARSLGMVGKNPTRYRFRGRPKWGAA